MKFKKNTKTLIIFIIIVLCVLFLFAALYKYFFKPPRESYKNMDTKFDSNFKIYTINLDKNPERLNAMKMDYNETDMKDHYEINRFSAVLGKEVDIEKWLTPKALSELETVEKTGSRTAHYQLTRGGVGCFLSHYGLMKQLVSDDSTDVYLILEDDITFTKDIYENHIQKILNKQPPKDWDFLFLGYHRTTQDEIISDMYKKPKSFWGMTGYFVNKNGAKKMVEELEKNKMDGQVDMYLSRMIQQDKVTIYVYTPMVIHTDGMTTDIQLPMVEKEGVDPFLYGDYKV